MTTIISRTSKAAALLPPEARAKRQISHEEAAEIVQRLINSHFRNKGTCARVSIPANPERDDDLLILSYIDQQRRQAEAEQLTAPVIIADILEHWLTFDKAQRDKEGIATTDDTHIMCPPSWPTHGQLTRWIAELRKVAQAVATGQCKARAQGAPGGNDPAECDWPHCGCDPHAEKVVAALIENGALQYWRPISEPPRHDDSTKLHSIRVLGRLEGGSIAFAFYTPFYKGRGEDERKHLWTIEHFGWATKPTHWMPLPPAKP